MRRQSGRGMYDQLEETLSSMTMQLRSAIEADANMPPGTSSASGPFLRSSGWARQISAELGSVLLDTLGLAATIEWHVRQFQKCTGIVCELTVNVAPGFDLPEDYAETVFDIYNEALSNVARHAGASRVAIALIITPHEVTMVVRDNGIGLAGKDHSAGAGGIGAIRARSLAYKGFCEVVGTRQDGTTLTVSLPVA